MTMAAGLFGLTIEKFFNSGMSMTSGLESETLVKLMLAQDAYTPNFDTHDFRNDVTNEPGNSGTYAAGGSVCTTTELTVASPAATQIKYDSDDLSWTTATITARGGVLYHVTGGASSTDELISAGVFSGDVSSAGGTFTYQVHANGHWFIDYS